MRVFLSWSGERSRQVAEALDDWLPKVIQAVQPWISSLDIDKGKIWAEGLSTELSADCTGIICVTPENMTAPWLLFEAGALSRTVEHRLVCPYLFDLDPANLIGPLTQFQATQANRADTFKLVHTLNSALNENALPNNRLNDEFKHWWRDLERKLSRIHNVPQAIIIDRSQDDMLKEVLELVRGIARSLPPKDTTDHSYL